MPKFPQKKGGIGPAKRKKMPSVTLHTERHYITAQVREKLFLIC